MARITEAVARTRYPETKSDNSFIVVFRMMHTRPSGLASLILAALVGCGDGPTGNGGPPPSSIAVNLGNIFFQSVRNGTIDPAVDTLAVGGTVTWTWADAGAHTVRFEDPGLSESPEYVETGSVFSMPFPAAGTYAYDCSVHGPLMTGSIVVK